jgi:OmpA-OmpF porin, OOP family
MALSMLKAGAHGSRTIRRCFEHTGVRAWWAWECVPPDWGTPSGHQVRQRSRVFQVICSSPLHFARRFSSLLVCGFSALTGAAHAQEFQSEISAQRFDVAPGTNNFLVTRGLRTDGKMRWDAGFFANYGYSPIVVKGVGGGAGTVPRYLVVDNMITGDLMGSLTIIPEVQVSLKVPVSWAAGEDVPGQEVGDPLLRSGQSAVGLGDVQIEGKGRFYGTAESPLTLGGYVDVGFPVGNLIAPGAYLSNASVSAGGGLALDYRTGILALGTNLGGIYREEAVIGGTYLGPEMRFSVAGEVTATPVIRIVGDVFGSSNFGSTGGTGLEGDLGLRVIPLGSKIAVTLGGGAGILRGLGTPVARGFLGITYDSKVLDRDEDGITDDIDPCPQDVEDKDGFEDADGCPDLDNDDDALPDSADKCPNEDEDLDGFDDKDGCPDPDNDKDGVPDVNDHCVAEPETKNGFDDADGCPDVKDTDTDGVLDETDKCVDQAEDTDGFEDTDGCPDPDNDADGILDETDECSEQPEDGKGKDAQKTDGCPVDA